MIDLLDMNVRIGLTDQICMVNEQYGMVGWIVHDV